MVNLDAASRALEAVRRARENGKGRRPGSRDLERAARREGLADGGYSQALDKLRTLVGERKPLDLARRIQLAQQARAQERGGRDG